MARRRRKYTWFPNLGTDLPGAGNSSWSGRSAFLNVPRDGTQNTLVAPLTFDIPLEEADAAVAGNLVNIVGNEYVIERIVGKLHAEFIPRILSANTTFGPGGGATSGLAVATRLTAGFFIARADETDENIPIGAETTAELNESYNPASTACIREPWMWRRTWVLLNDGIELGDDPIVVGNGGNLEGIGFPFTTAGYNSVADGPHIDIKSGRRVGQDERLWLALCVQLYPAGLALNEGTGDNEAQTVRVELDYRILGALRKAHNRGVF